ncbi:MAG: Asp-tRNA(Asn)/Glu-tRNA(Gln) amidotransferase subunit GatC [Gammaproteobacteria bacterium]
MGLSREDIASISHLARLELDEKEIPEYEKKMSGIVALMDQLKSVDTADVTPMAHPLDMHQRLRADQLSEADQRELFQQNAQDVEQGLYTVPKVIE